jgi:hypothetical protein
VSLVLQVVVALLGGAAALGLALRWPRLGLVVAILAAAATAGLALSSGADDVLAIGRTGVQATATARVLALGWSAGLILLGLLGLIDDAPAAGTLAGGSGLMALAGAIVALTVDDVTVAFAALAAGSAVAVAAPILGGWAIGRDDAPPIGPAERSLAAVVGAGLVAIAVAAWSQSPSGPLGDGGLGGVSDASLRTTIGLAVVAMAAATVLRAGAIPLHLWAARLVGIASPLALPAVLAWGAAAFTIVAVGWGGTALGGPPDDLDRTVIVVTALASIVFGGLASMLHDDLEHVLGYLLVQAAGVALLAMASLRPEATDAVAAWVIASAALATALAGWIAAMRWTFGRHRVEALHGWGRRSPVLAFAFLVILVGSVGIPGTALFEARSQLAAEALPGPLATLAVVVALSPLLALGRVLAAGLGRTGPDVAAAPDERVGRTLGSIASWSRGGAGGWLRVSAAVVRANQGLAVAVVAALLAVLGVVLSIAGVPAAAG